MCNTDDCIRILNENMPYIRDEYEVTGLCLFGSVARGDNKSDSDVDILVDMPPKITLMADLKEFLEKTLNTSVDLIRRHSHMSARFLSNIARDGITLL